MVGQCPDWRSGEGHLAALGPLEGGGKQGLRLEQERVGTGGDGGQQQKQAEGWQKGRGLRVGLDYLWRGCADSESC